MFWPFVLEQTMNAHFLSPLQWLVVLYDCTWILFHSWTLVYQRPEGYSTPGYTALPRMKVNVLTIYTGANHEYTLSKPTAMASSAV